MKNGKLGKILCGLLMLLVLSLGLCGLAAAEDAAPYTPLDQLVREDNKIHMEDIDPAIVELLQANRINFDALRIKDLKSRVSWMADLTLNNPEQPLKDISWLQIFDNLTSITLYDAQLTDISLLGDYTGLTSVSLVNCGTFSIYPLTSCPDLASLELGYDASYTGEKGTFDLAPLVELKNLTSVILHGEGITDISALTSFSKKLTSLGLDGTAVADLSPLDKLTKITDLTIGGFSTAENAALLTARKKTVKNFTLVNATLDAELLDALKSCSKVVSLTLRDVTVSEPAFYDGLADRITTLTLRNVTLPDGSTVESLAVTAKGIASIGAPAPLLQYYLTKSPKKIKSIDLTLDEMGKELASAITACGKLEKLNLTFTADASIPSADWENLKSVDHCTLISRGKRIDNLDFVGQLSNCIRLTLQTAEIGSAKGIANMKNLYTLEIFACKIDDYGFLKNGDSNELLLNIYIYGSGLSDVGFVKNMPVLKTLYIDGNQVTDLSALANHATLYKVSVLNNPVSDYTPLTKIPNLGLVMLDQGGVITGSSIITKSENLDAMDYQALYDEAFGANQ